VDTPQTNIFYIHMAPEACEPLRRVLARERIRITVGPHTRLVTHLDVSKADIERIVAVFKAFFKDWRN
jgi:threonine aldolase